MGHRRINAAETASDDPSTTNSKSSVRRVNWKGERSGGAAGWGSGVVMGHCLSPLTVGVLATQSVRRRRLRGGALLVTPLPSIRRYAICPILPIH